MAIHNAEHTDTCCLKIATRCNQSKGAPPPPPPPPPARFSCQEPSNYQYSLCARKFVSAGALPHYPDAETRWRQGTDGQVEVGGQMDQWR